MNRNSKIHIVLVFGTFDILHPGHIYFLRAAKKHGNKLVVVVSRDSSARLRGKRTLFNESERKEIVENINYADSVILGDRPGKWSVIKKVKPDVICIGYDQNKNHPGLLTQLKFLKKKPKIIRIRGINTRRFSSSIFKRKLKK